MNKKLIQKKTGRYSDEKGNEGILAELPEVEIIGDKRKYLSNKWNKENPQSTSEMPLRITEKGFKKEYKPGAGYLSGYDPIAALPVEGAMLNPAFKLAGKGFKLIKNAIGSKGDKLTDNLFKFIGERNYPIEKIDVNKLGFQELELYNKFKKAKINIEKLSNNDLNELIKLRSKVITSSAPSDYNMHQIIDVKNIKTQKINAIRDNRIIGSLNLENPINKLYPKNTYNIAHIVNNKKGEIKGVGERLYNSGIEVAKQNNKQGIISGEKLASPESTIKTWEKYPNKKLINNKGEHSYGAFDNQVKDFNGKIYLLKDPTSKYIPTKSKIFDPSIIDSNGKMKIDWNNKDIYKGIIPLGILNLKQNE